MADAGLHVVHLAIDAHAERSASDAVEVTELSSPEELMFVVGRWLRPIVAVLHVVRPITFQPISSREHGSTGLYR
jgi:hypothetical protein